LLADIRDPASLGENILTLIKNDDLRDSITKNAYQRLQEEFSRDITAKNTYRTYMKTIDIDYETGSDHSLL